MELYLYVRATVSNNKLEDFYTAIRDFLATQFLQTHFGWRLLAGVKVSQEDFPPQKDILRSPLFVGKPDQTTFLNIWKLPDNQEATDVSQIMMQLSEQPAYVRLDNAVINESQDVVYRVGTPLTPNDVELQAMLRRHKQIAFVRHYLWRKDLAAYVVNFGILTPAWAQQLDYLYAGTYQTITGLLNEFWDVWGINAGDLPMLRAQFGKLARASDGPVGEAYRESIGFEQDGPDDGLIIAEPASYWDAAQ